VTLAHARGQRRPFTRRGQLELLVRHQTKWIVSALIRKRTLRLKAALREHEFAERRRWLTPERRLPIWRDVEVLVTVRRRDRHQRMAVGINEFDLPASVQRVVPARGELRVGIWWQGHGAVVVRVHDDRLATRVHRVRWDQALAATDSQHRGADRRVQQSWSRPESHAPIMQAPRERGPCRTG